MQSLLQVHEYNSDYSVDNIIAIYEDVFTGKRRVFPKGTWQCDETVRSILRYVMEEKAKLCVEEIPLVRKEFIAQYKLWGAMNRFKSLRSLIHFVYPGVYKEYDFYRVPVGYWSDVEKARLYFEECLERDGISFDQIPDEVSSERMMSWGMANILKRYGFSPFMLMEKFYPGRFREMDFKKVPHSLRHDVNRLRELFLEMLVEERLVLEDVPQRVTLAMLAKYRLAGVSSGSVSALALSLFPEFFREEDFSRTSHYWCKPENVKRKLLLLMKVNDVKIDEAPRFFTKKRFQQEKLGGLLAIYRGSPIDILYAAFPGRFDVLDFQRVPNQHWFQKENRIRAMRHYVKKHQIETAQIPLLNRAYFKKHEPRFVSIADRHYDSKFYLWITKSFPEHTFQPESFQLLVGVDGQLCDSKEELVLHNAMLQLLPEASIKREAARFLNEAFDEVYIPDWIIEQNGVLVIVEYFGLYGSDLYPGYTEKAERKMVYYQSLDKQEPLFLYPGIVREKGFSELKELLRQVGLKV